MSDEQTITQEELEEKYVAFEKIIKERITPFDSEDEKKKTKEEEFPVPARLNMFLVSMFAVNKMSNGALLSLCEEVADANDASGGIAPVEKITEFQRVILPLLSQFAIMNKAPQEKVTFYLKQINNFDLDVRCKLIRYVGLFGTCFNQTTQTVEHEVISN